MSTHSRAGDNQRLAARILFAETLRYNRTLSGGLMSMLTSDASSVVKSTKQKAQSNSGAPHVIIRDLTKTHGDWVSTDLIHELWQTPTMGDRYLEGREEKLTRDSFDIMIDQGRHAVDMGGKMTQQRRGYELLELGKKALGTYYAKLQAERMLFHLAGARGKYIASDVILPLDTPTSDLPSFLVNDLEPPTFNRMFYAGNADSIDGTTGNAITPADVFDRPSLDNLSASLQEMPHPPRAIDLSTREKPMDTEPFYIFLVTPRMWQTFKQTSLGFDELVANATRRAKGYNHHLFKGDCFMLDNILVKKYHLPIRFNQQSTMMVSNDDNSATTHAEVVPQGVTVDRGMLLGACAVATAYGQINKYGSFAMQTDKRDYKNKKFAAIEWMDGSRKIRFRDKTGRIEDYGVICMDAAVQA